MDIWPPSVTSTGFTINRYSKLTVEYYNWFIAPTINTHPSDLSARRRSAMPFRDAPWNRSHGTAIDDRPYPVDSPLRVHSFSRLFGYATCPTALSVVSFNVFIWPSHLVSVSRICIYICMCLCIVYTLAVKSLRTFFWQFAPTLSEISV